MYTSLPGAQVHKETSGDHVLGYQSVIHVDSQEKDYRLNINYISKMWLATLSKQHLHKVSEMFFSLHTHCASISS